MQGGEFFPYPMTERIANVRFSGDATSEYATQNMLSVGVQRLTEDAKGLKIAPTNRIVVAIGSDANAEEKAFDLHVSMARHIAKRILEMADEAEKQDAA